MSIVLKSGSLNLLEPSGPVQACNGIALPSPFASYEEEVHKFCWGKPRVRGHFEDTETDMWTLLEGKFRQLDRELTWIELARNSGGLL